MNRRLFTRWTAWLLPLLVLRAFLPAGFMLSADAGAVSLVFCPGQTPAVTQVLHDAAADHSMHQMHHMSNAAHHGGGSAQLDPPCLYALAAVAIAADVPHLAAEGEQFSDESASFSSIRLPRAGLLRADRIRGPPSLS